MLRKLFNTAIIAAGICSAPIGLSAHSLGDALSQAYTSSDLLTQQRFLLRGTSEDVAGATAAFRPVISFLGSVTHSDSSFAGSSLTSTLQLQMELTLRDGGQRGSTLEAAKQAVLAARYALIEAEQNVLLNAANAYFTLRQDQRNVALRENNMRLLREQLRATRDRFDVGEVTRTDVALSESRLAQAQSQLAAAKGQVEISKANYAFAIGHQPHKLDASPRLPQLPKSEADAIQIALRTHPSLKRQQHTVTAAQFQASAAQQRRQGTLGMQAGIGLSDTRNDDLGSSSNSSLALNFRQPIYSGGALSSSSRKAQAHLSAARSALAQQGRIVANNVSTSWAQLEIARAQLRASQQQIEAAQLAFEGTREEANLGARTTLDVLNAEQELLDARTAGLQANTAAQRAVYQVLSAMGLMTASHLGLAVDAYDPRLYYEAVSRAPAFSGVPTSETDDKLERLRGRY